MTSPPSASRSSSRLKNGSLKLPNRIGSIYLPKRQSYAVNSQLCFKAWVCRILKFAFAVTTAGTFVSTSSHSTKFWRFKAWLCRNKDFKVWPCRNYSADELRFIDEQAAHGTPRAKSIVKICNYGLTFRRDIISLSGQHCYYVGIGKDVSFLNHPS